MLAVGVPADTVREKPVSGNRSLRRSRWTRHPTHRAYRLKEELHQMAHTPFTRGLRLTAYGALALGLVVGTSACSGGSTPSGNSSEGGDVTISFQWWGNDERAELTEKAIDLFEEQNPGVTVETSFSAIDAYIPKLATQIASGSQPDLFLIPMESVKEYTEKQATSDISRVHRRHHLRRRHPRGDAEDRQDRRIDVRVHPGHRHLRLGLRPERLGRRGPRDPRRELHLGRPQGRRRGDPRRQRRREGGHQRPGRLHRPLLRLAASAGQAPLHRGRRSSASRSATSRDGSI